MHPQAIIISPGPCTPNEAGCSLAVIEAFYRTTPMLGVCLGHQAIVQALGGTIVPANQPMHGRESELTHRGSRMFAEIPSPFMAGRYHSLVAEKSSLPDSLRVTAFSEDHTIMAVEHKSLPLIGVQFHPESILTQHGYVLIRNFLRLAGVEVPDVDPDAVNQFFNHTCSSLVADSHDS